MIRRSPDTELAQVLLDLDRCQHGRHVVDPCPACPGGHSAGNPCLRPGLVIGHGPDGTLIRVPLAGYRHEAAAWRWKGEQEVDFATCTCPQGFFSTRCIVHAPVAEAS